MRISHLATYLALAASTVHAVSVPTSDAVDVRDERAVSVSTSDIFAPENALEKRKGGGGKGSSGGRGGGRGGGSGGGSSSGSSGGRTSPNSNAGGFSRGGSGPPRAYGGGFYGGGAAQPYASGRRTPKGLIAGALIAPALLVGLLAGSWAASAYPYYYNNPYRFVNESAQNETFPQGVNTSLPVLCLCEKYKSCGCDENDDRAYLDDLVGNGSYSALNKTLVNVAEINGTTRLVINGTLPNGTTAPGGFEDAAMALGVGTYSGYWVMALIVFYTVMFA